MGHSIGFVIDEYLPLGGGKMTGDLDIGQKDITNSYEAVTAFMRRNPPIYIPHFVGFTETLVGTGGVTQAQARLTATTGATAASSGLATAIQMGFERATTNNIWTIDWTKKLLLLFYLSAQTGDANVTRWVQLQVNNTLGNLTGKGIGVVIANLTLSGESYGSARGTTGSSVLTSANVYEIAILHEPAIPRITWYVNGTSIGSTTTAANMPTTNSAAVYFCVGAESGTPGANVACHVAHIFAFPEQGG